MRIEYTKMFYILNCFLLSYTLVKPKLLHKVAGLGNLINSCTSTDRVYFWEGEGKSGGGAKCSHLWLLLTLCITYT